MLHTVPIDIIFKGGARLRGRTQKFSLVFLIFRVKILMIFLIWILAGTASKTVYILFQ